MTASQLLLFLPAALLIGGSPGANNILAFISGAKAGWWRAAQGILGRLAAWAVLIVLVSLGLNTLLKTSEIAFVALKWIGVAYLLYLAWQFWGAETETRFDAPQNTTLMRREFLTLLGNPKAYLLLTAFLPQFTNETAPMMTQLFVLGGIYIVVEAVAALLWVGAGAFAGSRALTPWRRKIVNRVSAGLMAGAALLLAKSQRAA